MNIIKFDKTELTAALQPVLSVVERRNSLPILLNVLIKFEGNHATFTTSDVEIQISSTILKERNHKEDFEITVSARKLYEISKSLSEAIPISLSLEQEKLIVTQKGSRFSLQTIKANEFPLIDPGETNTVELTLKSTDIKQLLDSVAFSMAVQDVRYYLNGLFLKIDGKDLIAVTTDGHRLCFNKMSVKAPVEYNGAISCIIPRKAVIEIQKIINSEKNIEIKFSIYQNFLRVSFPGKVLITKLIEGNYPDYQKVIPQDSKNKVVFSKDELLEKLNRLSILTSDKYRGIRIMLSGEKVLMKSNNADQEEAAEELFTEEGSGELDIGFNVTYLIEALNNIKTDKIGFSFNDSQSSAVITDSENKYFKYIVMPMRL